MEAFESSGIWWLPDSPDMQSVGILRYSDADGFNLSIPFGHIGGMKNMADRINQAESTPLVFGMLRNGKHVVLFDLLMTNMTINMPGAGSEEYYASLGFVGPQEAIAADPHIKKARMAFTHLRDWIQTHPCVSEHRFDDEKHLVGADYHYEMPPAQELVSGDGWRINLIHTASLPFASVKGFDLSHDCEIELLLDSPLDYGLLSEKFVGPLWQFFTFCLDRSVDNTSLRIQAPDSDEWLDVGRHLSVSASDDKVILPDFMLLSFAQIGERVADVLASWLSCSGDERRAISILVGLIGEREMPSDLRFLAVAQSLEALSRVGVEELELDSAEFTRRLDIVKSSISDSKVKRWVVGKLKASKARPAGELLQQMLGDIGDYVTQVAPNREVLLQDLRDNRNFYTHRGSRRPSRVRDGGELYTLTQAGLLILKATTLRRLGFTQQEVCSIMDKCQGALQWRARTAKQYAVEASP